MSTLTNRDPRFARQLSHVRDVLRTFVASLHSRINLWSRLFSHHIIRGRVTFIPVPPFHGLLTVKLLPGHCPLCVPEIRGWSFEVIALLPAAQNSLYFVLRHDSLISWSDCNHLQSHHGRLTVRLDLIHRQPTVLVFWSHSFTSVTLQSWQRSDAFSKRLQPWFIPALIELLTPLRVLQLRHGSPPVETPFSRTTASIVQVLFHGLRQERSPDIFPPVHAISFEIKRLWTHWTHHYWYLSWVLFFNGLAFIGRSSSSPLLAYIS